MIGQMLGHYEITGKIGKGGMGIVYRATDTLIGRDVALKTILLREIEDPNERQFLKERLFREAKSAGILSHPNIVTVFQIGEQDSLTYIAMEFVDGPNLAELLNSSEKPTLETLVSILDQSAAALDYAHSRGVVHRDIKPGNIIVRTDGVAKIADFGVAKISSQNVTRTGMTLGTPHYMSPEQFHGRTIDGRSDQYSLAVMVYEIFTGKKPFTAESITGLMYKILHEEPNPRRDNPDLSEEADAILRKALSKDPDGRYPSCTEFIAQLRGVSGVTLKQLPFESHTRTPHATTSSRQNATPHSTPTSSTPPAAVPHVPSATPSSAFPSSGMMPPPPPVPPSQAWNFRSPEAGSALEDIPTPATFPKSGAASTPIADSPTPATGMPTASNLAGASANPPGGSSAGINLPPPPAPAVPSTAAADAGGKSDTKAGSAKPSNGKADKRKTAKSPAAPKTAGAPGSAKPASKMPLVVIGGVVLLLMIVGIVATVIYTRSQATPPPEEAVTTEQAPPDPQQASTELGATEEMPAEATETPVPEEVPAETPGGSTPAVQYAPPAIATFIAEPAAITSGQSTTLRWNTSDTTLVSVEPGLARGRSVGQFSVSPKQTTKYRLVAKGYGGRKTQELTVTVRPAEEGGGAEEATPNPQGMSLDALTRALSAGENVVSMNQLMVRVGLNGVSFPVTPQSQAAILAAGERGERPKDSVVRLVDLARRGGRR
ncbi:MAG: protein kinase [Bryobacterales bacterium]|nr:protein kinase [Bryobacterales bacterium]